MPVDSKENRLQKKEFAFRYFGGNIPPEIFEKVDGISYETAEEKCGAICAFLRTSSQKRTKQIKECIDEWNESNTDKIKFQPIFGDDEIVTFTREAKPRRHHLYKTIKAQSDAKNEGKDSTYKHWGKKSAEDEADEEALQYAEDEDGAGFKPSDKMQKKVKTLAKQLGMSLTKEISKPANPGKRASIPVLTTEADFMPNGSSKRMKKSNGKNMGGAPANGYDFALGSDEDHEPMNKPKHVWPRKNQRFAFCFRGEITGPEIFKPVGVISLETCSGPTGVSYGILFTARPYTIYQVKSCVETWNDASGSKITLEKLDDEDSEIVIFKSRHAHFHHIIYKCINAQKMQKSLGMNSTYMCWGEQQLENNDAAKMSEGDKRKEMSNGETMADAVDGETEPDEEDEEQQLMADGESLAGPICDSVVVAQPVEATGGIPVVVATEVLPASADLLDDIKKKDDEIKKKNALLRRAMNAVKTTVTNSAKMAAAKAAAEAKEAAMAEQMRQFRAELDADKKRREELDAKAAAAEAKEAAMVEQMRQLKAELDEVKKLKEESDAKAAATTAVDNEHAQGTLFAAWGDLKPVIKDKFSTFIEEGDVIIKKHQEEVAAHREKVTALNKGLCNVVSTVNSVVDFMSKAHSDA